MSSPLFALLQRTANGALQPVHDSLAVDSISMDNSPLPGGVASVFRFLFSRVPQWVQIGGVVVGVVVALVLCVVAWRRRTRLAAWITSRSRGYKIALGSGVGGTLLAVGLSGGWAYHYMMHENDFCSSCHVMKSAFGTFGRSEHSELKCHSCHQQSLYASSRQVYFWVMDRPDRIPAHAKVPNTICAECHITQHGDSGWQRVGATAGHRVHLDSGSAALRDVMCVSCHARQVHAFKSNDLSCAQAGCHENLTVKLGKMAGQTALHCTVCHEFSKPVSRTVSIDSAKQALVPLKPQCFSCHEMRQQLQTSGLDKDPHKAACGTCHNPHTQEKAAGALKTCANSECHANADTLTAFHRGLGKHGIDNCVACHKAHTWKVVATDCLGCHKNIFDEPRKNRRIAVFEPVRLVPAAIVAAFRPHPGGPREAVEDVAGIPGLATQPVGVPPSAAEQAGARAGSPKILPPFSHARHRKLRCESCHDSRNTHGALTVRSAASCQGCHHAKDAKAGTCATCHGASTLGTPHATPVVIHVSTRQADVTRELRFEHTRHVKVTCGACHADDVARTVTRTCAGCHTDHHAVDRTCSSCHPTPRVGHTRATHDGCATCHADASVAAFPPVRSLCLTCHTPQEAHHPEKECVACHRVSWNEVKVVGASR